MAVGGELHALQGVRRRPRDSGVRPRCAQV